MLGELRGLCPRRIQTGAAAVAAVQC
jgi:hypothetical protein